MAVGGKVALGWRAGAFSVQESLLLPVYVVTFSQGGFAVVAVDSDGGRPEPNSPGESPSSLLGMCGRGASPPRKSKEGGEGKVCSEAGHLGLFFPLLPPPFLSTELGRESEEEEELSLAPKGGRVGLEGQDFFLLGAYLRGNTPGEGEGAGASEGRDPTSDFYNYSHPVFGMRDCGVTKSGAEVDCRSVS